MFFPALSIPNSLWGILKINHLWSCRLRSLSPRSPAPPFSRVPLCSASRHRSIVTTDCITVKTLCVSAKDASTEPYAITVHKLSPSVLSLASKKAIFLLRLRQTGTTKWLPPVRRHQSRKYPGRQPPRNPAARSGDGAHPEKRKRIYTNRQPDNAPDPRPPDGGRGSGGNKNQFACLRINDGVSKSSSSKMKSSSPGLCPPARGEGEATAEGLRR